MKKLKENILKKMGIKKFGLIKCDVSDPIYIFCVINDIDNLYDFIETYKKKRDSISALYDTKYFDGMIDLINLIMFDENIKGANHFKDVIEIKDGNVLELHKNNDCLARLGFNLDERIKLFNFVKENNSYTNNIMLIKSYLNSYEFKNMGDRDEILITKLYVLSEYYNKNKEIINLAKGELEELKLLLKKYKNIKEKICCLSESFEGKVDKLPSEQDDVKRLIKNYKEIVCNKK